MAFALLAVFTLALVGEGIGDVSWTDADDGQHLPRQPCRQASDRSKYDRFVDRHVLNESIDVDETDRWSRFLAKKELCGRSPVQSFILADEGQVDGVCGTSGERVKDGGNLCISKSRMTVYDVRSRKVNGKCLVTDVKKDNRKVVLACNKVDKACSPVHYEKWKHQRAGGRDCSDP